MNFKKFLISNKFDFNNEATKGIVDTGGGPGQDIESSKQSPNELFCKAGRHIVSDMGQQQYHSIGDFDGSEVGGRVGPFKASETQSLGQSMLDYNDTGVKGSKWVVHSKG